MEDLISIIIPIYNVEPYIRQALDSVINQTYKSLQIILVDDGSSDRCGDICNEYAAKDKRITVIHQENGGVSLARNAGIEVAKGDWIYFMDADDWIEQNTIQLALESGKKNGADMIFFAFDHVELNHRYRGQSLNYIDGTREYFFDDLSDVNTFLIFIAGGVSSALIRFKPIQDIRFDIDIRAYEDTLFRIACYSHIHSFSYIPNLCYHYRYRPGSATNGFVDPVKYLNDAKVLCEELKKHVYLFSKKEPLFGYANNMYLNAVSRMATTVIRNNNISALQKRKYIYDAISSDYYEKCFHCRDKTKLGKMTRLSSIFGKPSVSTIYFAYYCRNLVRMIIQKE